MFSLADKQKFVLTLVISIGFYSSISKANIFATTGAGFMLAQDVPPPPEAPPPEPDKQEDLPKEEFKAEEVPQTEQTPLPTSTENSPESIKPEDKSPRNQIEDKALDTGSPIKSELIYPGTVTLVSRFDHAGVQIGPQLLDSEPYLLINPVTAFYGDNWAFALNAPLNLLAFDIDDVKFGGLKIRREDWDEVSDYLRVIRFITIGKKEDKFYLTINSIRPYGLGHGMLIDKYQPNIDLNRSLTGMNLDLHNRYGGLQLMVNDLTFQNHVMGMLVFAKPFEFVDGPVHPILKSLSIGVEYAGDFSAPRCVRLSEDSTECVQARGHSGSTDQFTGEILDNSFARTDPDNGRYVTSNSVVHALGLSIEAKVFRLKDIMDIKAYQTWHQFLNTGGGSGLGTGALTRITLGSRWLNAFRIRTELQNYGDGFLPSYFDTTYEVNKYELAVNSSPYQVNPTKYQLVFGDEANGFERPKEGWRVGYKVDTSYALYHGSRAHKKIGLGFGVQDSIGPHDSTMYMHFEFPFVGWLQFFATYMRIKGDSFKNLFSFSANSEDVLLSGFRLQVLPIMFINISYARIYKVLRSPGQEYHLGNSSVPVPANRITTPHDRLYETTGNLMFTLEFGYEASDDNADMKAARND